MMMRYFGMLAAAIICATVMPTSGVAAWPEQCSQLEASGQTRARELMSELYPHDCCDDTLWNCLQQTTPSRLVWRLASGVCFRLAKGESDKDIKRELEKRTAAMMSSGAQATIGVADLAWAGDPAAPVTVVVYTCARCPYCSKSVPEMYEAVVNGSLKGKAKLGIRLFPVKSHPGSKEGAMAFEVARASKTFWPYVLLAYKRFDSFSESSLLDWAVEIGLKRETFASEMSAKSTRDRVVASKKEGLRNQVEATPTYFINGRLYGADLKTWALSCAILEEYDRVTGNLCQPE